MLDILKDYALKNIWCSPDQDFPWIIKPARLTTALGARDYYKGRWNNVRLPTQNEIYHVFQIGRINPKLIGISERLKRWVPLSAIIGVDDICVDFYFINGKLLPKFNTYLLLTRNNNMLVAIKADIHYPELANSDIYCRYYNNAYYESGRALPDDRTATNGLTVRNQEDTLLIQREIANMKAVGRDVLQYVNGMLVHEISPLNALPTDHIEWMEDSSIYKVLDFPVKDLKTFTSKVNMRSKFLLHHPDHDTDTIDFVDDIDIYLIRKADDGRFKGVFFNRHKRSHVTMVTHRDYAISVDSLQGYVDGELFSSLSDITIRMFIRKAGFKRPLITENNRINELYRLEPPNIELRLLGINSSIDFWRADNLEASAYTRLMGKDWGKVTHTEVIDAIGYNGICSLVNSNGKALIVLGETRYIDVPIIFRGGYTAFEYDASGVLLGYHYKTGDVYYATDPTATSVEFVMGEGSTKLDAVYGDYEVELDPELNHRMYLCDVVGDSIKNNWTDVTNTYHYEIEGNKVTWSTEPLTDYPLVISDGKFYLSEFDLVESSGVLSFRVNQDAVQFGEERNIALDIPPRDLSLFMNGRYLIRGLDYIVKWPRVYITNRTHLREGSQRIILRGIGLPADDMAISDKMEFGWVQHGYLSDNNSYDVREGISYAAFVGGEFRRKDELSFYEDNIGVDNSTPTMATPYVLHEYFAPFKALPFKDTYALQDEARKRDKIISTALNDMRVQTEIETPNYITGKYPIVSTFISKVIYLLENRVIDGDFMRRQFSEETVMEQLHEYEYLLDFDPAHLGLASEHVEIWPHGRSTQPTLDFYQYLFLRKAVEVYFDGAIEINSFINTVLPESEASA